MKIIAQGLGSIGALVGLGMFVHDTLARVFPFANPISARNNIMYILATAAFVEAVKLGSMEMTDFIVTYGDEKDQMSNSEMIIDTMFKATFTGVGLNVAGQNPLVKHGYTLYKSWDNVANGMSVIGSYVMNCFYGEISSSHHQQEEMYEWKDAIAPILYMLITMSMYWSISKIAKEYTHVSEVVDGIYKDSTNKEDLINRTYALLLTSNNLQSTDKIKSILSSLYDK